MRTNVAQRVIAYYLSNDFKNDYLVEMLEQYQDSKSDILERIVKICIDNDHYCNRRKAKRIYDYIYDNFEKFQGEMRNYWVGYNCLESVSFNEQEEQLDGLGMNLQYLKRIFNREGFVVNKNYAYYDMSGEGLKIDLKFTDEILAILND